MKCPPNIIHLPLAEQTEVIFLGQLRHPNLVKLIGYCCEDEHRLLVYEHMPRGCLENQLFRSKSFCGPISPFSAALLQQSNCIHDLSSADSIKSLVSTCPVGFTASLPWSTRMKIALGAAKGLAFLHEAEKPVIHRDFKSSNILLDSVSLSPWKSPFSSLYLFIFLSCE